MQKPKNTTISFYKRPQFFHTPEHNDDCVNLFGGMEHGPMIFFTVSGFWQKFTTTVPDTYQVCKIAKKCGYVMAFGRRKWKTQINIGEYSKEVSFEALGVALTLYCLQIFHERNNLQLDVLYNCLHEYAKLHEEAKQIADILSSCRSLQN